MSEILRNPPAAPIPLNKGRLGRGLASLIGEPQPHADAPLPAHGEQRLLQQCPSLCPALATGGRLVLVTSHRRENLGAGLVGICEALIDLTQRFPDVEIAYPVHPNPTVAGVVHDELGGEPFVRLVEPLDYPRFVAAMRASYLILSDSGGVQEEAPALGKPVLVTREITERPEAVEGGCAELVGPDTDRITAAARRLLTDARAYAKMAQARNPFGEGHASEQIALTLERDLLIEG